MSRHKKMGKVSTAAWVAIGGAAVVGIYLVTRPKTVYLPPPGTINTGYPYNSGNSTSSIISASGGAFSDIWGSIFGNP